MSEFENCKIGYGGFLPLELNPGKEYFEKLNVPFARFNSVKAAFDVIIRKIGYKKIYLPYYYCNSTTEVLCSMDLKVSFYHIDENLMPIDIPDDFGSIVMLVDYFGILGNRLKSYALSFVNAEVIIDMAHAFFDSPFNIDRFHFVYSAKKFFGVPDGAYLVSRFSKSIEENLTIASSYSDFLLVSYECGTNAAYNLKKEADSKFFSEYGGMSVLAQGLLRNADYNRVMQTRKNNYRILRSSLADYNSLDLPDDCPSYLFPLLLSGNGTEIKKRLVANKIYVPTLWTGKILLDNGNKIELSLSENAIFLPVDQRYNIQDMEYIVSKTKEIINENT